MMLSTVSGFEIGFLAIYSFDKNICLELGLEESYLPGTVSPLHSFHVVFVFKHRAV